MYCYLARYLSKYTDFIFGSTGDCRLTTFERRKKISGGAVFILSVYAKCNNSSECFDIPETINK